MGIERKAMTRPGCGDDALPIGRIGAPVVVSDHSGSVVGLSPQAGELFLRLGIGNTSPPFALPASLWNVLSATPTGDAIEWRPERGDMAACLGCTRYPLGESHTIILMQEVSAKNAELSRRLHQQRLMSTGRLVACIAHDVRTSVASILYNADFLSGALSENTLEDINETASELHSASRRLQGIVDGLLDFAKLGPPVSGSVSLKEVIKRASALVRPIYRERRHALAADIPEASEWVVGNALVIDQIFVNLLINAAEASEAPVSVSVDASPANGEQAARNGSASPLIRISVRDTGPGVPEPLRSIIFQPFFTTRAQGTGLGLTNAREAARDLGGDVMLCDSPTGAHFSVLLPAMSTAPTALD